MIHWYGPYFESLVIAFLSVVRHYDQQHNNPFEKAIVAKMLDQVACDLFPFVPMLDNAMKESE